MQEEANPQPHDPQAAIDAAMGGLEGLDDVPLAEHVERFDAVHAELTAALSTIDKV